MIVSLMVIWFSSLMYLGARPAELKELVLAGVNGKRKSTPRELRCIACFQCQKYFPSSSAIFGIQNSRAFRE